MGYDSQISFTLDTICPWTYLAKKRLDAALDQYRTAHPDSSVRFSVKYLPFQLYPEVSKEGEGKYEWYKRSKYGDSDEKMRMYTTIMSAYGRSVGIDFKFGGTVANTLDAHRLIQRYQEVRGPDCADKLINTLYMLYFENEEHPSSLDTLLKAAKEAGIPEDEAKAFLEDESEGLQEVKKLMQEQARNGTDAVPTVVFEGRKRDFTLVGAKEVQEYFKTMEQVAKEA
ncbi:thioredoxin-like protein [Eremomyces bilateralis CBS 781.70]|uniref:Thioredoxin-like protein n=1 Tax=Eremomyces bilateralis CBS 781.70 TaxID=1392243 RepID=A0A6G1GAQ5_9PEZI|nr:thioredoxin-like protein [Eremomyces bilateralis CBS 781.70]KAF1815113.1 thioredoxin-like protein [Eremomyces bilateralis CBS 781.70]